MIALDVAGVWYWFNDLIFYSFENLNEGEKKKIKAALVIEVM